MSTFITQDDYKGAINIEILNAITRNDANTLADAESRAIEEIKGYLSSRYKVDEIFAATGSQRNKVVLGYAIDVVLYHIHCIHNPAKMPEIRVINYDNTIKNLEKISKGMINPQGLPILTPQNEKGQLLFGGNKKNSNHY
jgi:hypothetical protein